MTLTTPLSRLRLFVVPLAAVLFGCGGPSPAFVTESSALDTVSSSIRGYTRSDGVHAVLFRKPGSHLFELAGAPMAPKTLTDMGGVEGGAPWGYRRSDDANVVMYVASDLHVHELGRDASGTFVDNDWTAFWFVAAPPAGDTGVDVIGRVRSDGRNAVVYRGQNNHIIEVVSNFPNSPPWIVTDVTDVTGIPDASGNVFPFIRQDGNFSVVYIAATDGHVHEVVRTSSGTPTFLDADLFTASGETVTPASDLWALAHDNMNDVFYVGTDQRLHELRWTVGSTCQETGQAVCKEVILPATVRPLMGLRPSAYQLSDATFAVVYCSATFTFREAHRFGTGNWSDVALPVGTSLPFGQPFAHRAPFPLTNSVLLPVYTNGVGMGGMELSGKTVFGVPYSPYQAEIF